ncbi:MAG: hypothetical protein WBW33_06270 [Bryobacteraceae bacterium]
MSSHALKIGIALVLIQGCVIGQRVRDDWKVGFKAAELRPRLETTLEKALLTKPQHADILAALADKTFTDSYSSEELPEAKRQLEKTSLGMHVAGDRASFFVLEGAPGELRCGATGNCPIWVFLRRGTAVTLVLESKVWGLILRNETSHGLPDLVTNGHQSAREGFYLVYRFDGSKYHQSDCYIAHYGDDGDPKPIRMTDCGQN